MMPLRIKQLKFLDSETCSKTVACTVTKRTISLFRRGKKSARFIVRPFLFFVVVRLSLSRVLSDRRKKGLSSRVESSLALAIGPKKG